MARNCSSHLSTSYWTTLADSLDSFITFRSTPHLNGKHTVFGQILAEESFKTLGKIEKVNIEPATNRPLKPIKLLDVSVFKNPFDEYQEQLSKKLSREAATRDQAGVREQQRLAREKDRTTWLGGNLGDKGGDKMMSTAGLGSVGKYLDSAGGKRKAAEASLMSLPSASEPQGKKKKSGGGFGNFDAW